MTYGLPNLLFEFPMTTTPPLDFATALESSSAFLEETSFSFTSILIATQRGLDFKKF